MCAKSLRKRFPSLRVIQGSIPANMKVSGFRVFEQVGKKVVHYRMVFRKGRYTYIVPEREFARTF